MTSITETFPTVGNLVDTEYLIGSANFKGLNRNMPCHSVILADDALGVDSLIISDKELVNANTRYIRKVTKETGNPASRPLGVLQRVQIVSDNKNKRPVDTWFAVFTHSDGIPCGYMFSPSELGDIINRTKRIPKTVVRLSWWQKLVTWFINKFCK